MNGFHLAFLMLTPPLHSLGTSVGSGILPAAEYIYSCYAFYD